MMNSRQSNPSSTSPVRSKEAPTQSYAQTVWMIFSILLWCLLLAFIHLVLPNQPLNIFAFFVLIFSSFLSTFLVLIPNQKLCLILTFLLISLLLLLFFHQFNILNLILIIGIFFAIFFYSNKKNSL